MGRSHSHGLLLHLRSGRQRRIQCLLVFRIDASKSKNQKHTPPKEEKKNPSIKKKRKNTSNTNKNFPNQTDRKHNLPRPRRKLPPHRHPRPSLDEIPHRNPLLPARRSPNLLLPPLFRRAQTLGAGDFIRLPNARDGHRGRARALRVIK